MPEREGLEPALRAHRGKYPYVPHLNQHQGKLCFPKPLQGSNLCFLILLRKNGGEGGIRTLERMLLL